MLLFVTVTCVVFFREIEREGERGGGGIPEVTIEAFLCRFLVFLFYLAIFPRAAARTASSRECY